MRRSATGARNEKRMLASSIVVRKEAAMVVGGGVIGSVIGSVDVPSDG